MTHTATQVRDWLWQLPSLAALLPVALVVGPTRSGVHVTPPPPGSRPLGNLDLVALLDTRTRWDWAEGPRGAVDPDRMGLLPHLDTWARDLEADALDADLDVRDLPETATVAGLCDWMIQDGLLDWAEASLPQWPEYADDMQVIHARVLAAVAHLRDDDQVGHDPVCGACHAGKLRRDASHASLWRCDACARFVTTRAVGIQEAATLVDYPRSTLYRWAAQGRFTRILGDGGKALYDLGEIRAEVAKARLGDVM